MIDARFEVLAEVLTGFSTKLKDGERVLIDAFDAPPEMVIALIRSARSKGAFPFVNLQSNVIARELLRGADEEQYRTLRDFEMARMKAMDAYVALRGSHNATEFSDVAPDRMQLAMKLLQPLVEQRVNKTKWVVLRWPTPAMAQMAGMSTEAFEELYFKVCTLNYAKMEPGMEALKSLMENTDQVRITGPGTDLRFSIKGIPAIMCGGQHNIPDGEVFSCPVRDSVEGYVQFNAPTVYQGTAFDSVRLAFKNGKVVDATSNKTERLNAILDSDEGARYIGEFALGFNPYIREPMRDILFDEKIAGSFHFTPGQAYERADNGNRSQVHWDLVCIQRPDYGGGEIYFDQMLIRKDGLFSPKQLQGLNPDNFKS
ncbi:MAG: aminopeptidase [Verrucomicrobia bacterium]|nr:aminopeptidase [Verrucomicrobiota bacterium]